MILIADSGSSKTRWCLVDKKSGQVIKEVFTKGLNPYHQTIDSIAYEIEMSLMNEIRQYAIGSVYFYGAGCEFDKKEDVRKAISLSVKCSTIEVGSDLVAAARSLLKDESGIACILGTGSNSCYYDGKEIVENITSLGYILDDLGSGSALGKDFMRACFKKHIPKDIVEKFLKQYQLNTEIILDKIYKQPLASRFLASASPFLLENLDVPEIRDIIKNCFRQFFDFNIVKYDNYRDAKLTFTGSIAFYYQNFLEEVANEYGLKISLILQSPMDGLLDYHTQN